MLSMTLDEYNALQPGDRVIVTFYHPLTGKPDKREIGVVLTKHDGRLQVKCPIVYHDGPYEHYEIAKKKKTPG